MIAIVEYGMGNANSVKKAFDFLGIKSIITSNQAEISTADKLLIPGVGAFGDAVDALHELSLFETILETVEVKQKPILGICLGMQLLTKGSEESKEKDGFSFLDTTCKKFTTHLKIPHVGWNDIQIDSSKDTLFKNIPNGSDFYFVHSFHLDAGLDHSSSHVEYAYNFTSSIEKENIFGVQFHPEKSQKYGLELLKNFGNL